MKSESEKEAQDGGESGEQEERGSWGNNIQFLLSCVGLSVGIGNVWRFPYLAYENGGGAFLIPYLIMLLLAGKPMYYLELAIGQFSGKGPTAVWKCAPICKGIGLGMYLVTLMVAIYYNVQVGYTIFYVASSFTDKLPWTWCDPEWADNQTCAVKMANFTYNETFFQSPSQQYWERFVLKRSDGIDNLGTIKWDASLCLLLVWIITALCLLKGIKTSGKIIYFAATFPYVILLTLLVTGLLQPGAMKGVIYFLKPEWHKLLDITVWQKAAGQMFFSLGVSTGSLIMYSSYNNFKNNVYRDAMIVSVLDTLTSIIAGLVIFSVLGTLSESLNIGIEKVAQSGSGLAFVAYPEALTRLPVPQLWTVLFFVMLFILGLDSEFALVESMLTSMADEFNSLRKYKTTLCLIFCAILFVLGLPCVTLGGQYVVQLMDSYSGDYTLTFLAICESVAFSWIYGVNRVCDDIEFMTGRRPGWYWRITWFITSPLVLGFIFIYSLVTFKPLKYNDGREFPEWANAIGWLMSLVCMGIVPLWALIAICRQPGDGIIEKIRNACNPTSDWGPSDATLKEKWMNFKSEGEKLNTKSRKTSRGIDNQVFDNSEHLYTIEQEKQKPFASNGFSGHKGSYDLTSTHL